MPHQHHRLESGDPKAPGYAGGKLLGVKSRIPTYYEVYPGSMSDTKTLSGFLERMRKYGMGTIRTLLDRGFYSAKNIESMLKGHAGFYIPVPANIKWATELIDEKRDAVEMPDNVIWMSEDGLSAVYGMTVLDRMGEKRVWKHVYYDTARRSEHIASLFSSLKKWEQELVSGDIKKDNQWAYDRYFIVKETPKRGKSVKWDMEAVNSYKQDRAGYWVILTNCEKDAGEALGAYKERSYVESSFDDMKNDLEMRRMRTHGPDTMRGRIFVQFLALVITAQLRAMLNAAWDARLEVPKEDRLARRYPLNELMLRLGSYRNTSFPGRYGKVASTPTKTQRAIFLAFGVEF
jgi:transposase